jgi:predicted DNA-binding protein
MGILDKITLITQLNRDTYNKLTKMVTNTGKHLPTVLEEAIEAAYQEWIRENWEYDE